MATSSITHNFVISDPEEAERFANALEEAEKNKVDLSPSNVQLLKDPKEIQEFMKGITDGENI